MSRRFALAVSSGVALSLLALGIPQTISAYRRIPADIELPAIADGRLRDAAVIQAAQAALSSANAIYPSALTASDIAWSHIYRWRTQTAAAAMRAELMAADSGLRNSLAHSPGNARDWAGLALVRNALADPKGAAEALELSMMLYPYQPEWALWRCDIGFLIYSDLSEFGRGLFLNQLRFVWARRPEHLLASAKLAGFSSPDGIALLKTALANDPPQMAKLETALGSQRP